MQLLYLVQEPPLPANSGLRQRTWMLLQCLHQLGHRVTLVSLAPTDAASRRQLANFCEWIEPPLPSRPHSATWPRLFSFATPWPASVCRFRFRHIRRLLQSLLQTRHFDALIADTIFAAANLPRSRQPVMINHHNVEYRIPARYAACEPRLWRRAYAQLETVKLRRWERLLLRQARLHLACSEIDAVELTRLGGADCRLFVVPNAVDAEYWLPANGRPDPNCVAFSGTLDWHPNRDALHFFISRILPVLRRLVPRVKFLAIGQPPPREFLRRFAHLPEVEFSGSVPDVRPWLARAAVFAAPLRMGSGTRLKLVQAACLAMPIVSTRLGAEGLEFEAQKEILLADSAEDFARALAQLMTDAELRQRLGAAARRKALALYSLPVCRHALAHALQPLELPPPAAASCASGEFLKVRA